MELEEYNISGRSNNILCGARFLVISHWCYCHPIPWFFASTIVKFYDSYRSYKFHEMILYTYK